MPLAAPPGWLPRPPASRSGAGPSPIPLRRAADGQCHAADASPGSAEPSRPGCAVCSVRSASSALPFAASAEPAAVRSGPFRGARGHRSPPCAEAWEAAARGVPRRPSDAELLAPLCPATGKHAPTTLRSHASAEAVFPLPGALLGLVGPLHESVPVLVQRRRIGPTNTRTAGVIASLTRGHHGAARLACLGILATRRRGCQTSGRPAARC